MTSSKNEVALPKWPGFIVKGKSVTKEQAMQIILQTNPRYFSCNFKDVEQRFEEILGIPKFEKDNNNWVEWSNKAQEAFDAIGHLDLQYLNNHRIVSAYVGGPHGWCDWEGEITASSYNIGKWPTVKEVLKEWRLIAKRYPFLELECQLLDDEICEGCNGKPLVQFSIKGGRAKVVSTGDLLLPPVHTPLNMHSIIYGGRRREQGCSFERFREMVALCQNLVRRN
jgi:hypothetical protein